MKRQVYEGKYTVYLLVYNGYIIDYSLSMVVLYYTIRNEEETYLLYISYARGLYSEVTELPSSLQFLYSIL